MINEEAAIRVETWIREAVAAGARLRCGGGRQGTMIVPAVLTDVTYQMNVMCEEIFGPVVTVSPYDTLD